MAKSSKKMTPKSAFNALTSGCKLAGDKIEELKSVIAETEYAYKYVRHTGLPFPEGEDAIAKFARTAQRYAEMVLKGPFEKGEAAIATDAIESLEYAENVLKGRFEKGEPVIAADAHSALSYARLIVKGPWEMGEKAIAKKALTACQYAIKVLKGPFPLGEEAISKDGFSSVCYATFLQTRFAAGEDTIAAYTELAMTYAISMRLKDFLTPLVSKIAKEPSLAYIYATCVLKGRFKAGEAAMIKSYSAYDLSLLMYLRYVESGGTDLIEMAYRVDRLKELCAFDPRDPIIADIEAVIAQSAMASLAYAASNKKEFPAGEVEMRKSDVVWKAYLGLTKSFKLDDDGDFDEDER